MEPDQEEARRNAEDDEESNELAISKVIEEISKGPIFEITLKDCFNAFTKNIQLKKEMRELKNSLRAKEAFMDQTMKTCQEKVQELERELAEKNTIENIKQYKDECEKLDKQIQDMEADHKNAISDYEKSLRQAEKEMEKYENEIEYLKYDLHDSENLNKWMKDEIHKADDDIKEKDDTIKKLRRQNEELKKQLKEQNKEFEKLPTTHSDIKKLVTFLKKYIPEISQDKLDHFLKTYEALHFCHICKKSVPYALNSRKRHIDAFHGKDSTTFYKCFPGSSEMCRCGQTYKRENQKSHIKAHHYDVKFKCAEKGCDFSGVLGDMEKHLAEAHIDIADNDSALAQLVTFCFDPSIPIKLARKTFYNKDRRRSTEDLTILESKLEEIIKLQNSNIELPSTDDVPRAITSQDREYNPSFEDGMCDDSPMKKVQIKNRSLEEELEEADAVSEPESEPNEFDLEKFDEFYEDPHKNDEEKDDDEVQREEGSKNWSKIDFDSISLHREDMGDVDLTQESSKNRERLGKTPSGDHLSEDNDDDEREALRSEVVPSKYQDLDRPGSDRSPSRASGKDPKDFRRSLSNVFDAGTPSKGLPDSYKRRKDDFTSPQSSRRMANRLSRDAYDYSSSRKRKYSPVSPNENLNQGYNNKHMRITVNNTGMRYVGGHMVERLRDKNYNNSNHRVDCFTKKDVEQFLEEADQDLFCRYFYNQKCNYGVDCIRIHDKTEITKGLRDEIAKWKKEKLNEVIDNTSKSDIQKAIRDAAPHKMCQWFKKSHKCKFGTWCWDIHDEHEITVGLKKEVEKYVNKYH